MNNPFSVKTPERLSPQDIADLFIEVSSDFPRLTEKEHTFLHGSRGTGKSMMLRYLEPEVQFAAKKIQNASELNYYAIHMPIKQPAYNITEADYLTDTSYYLFSEHFLLINATILILESLSKLLTYTQLGLEQEEEIHRFTVYFIDLAKESGCSITLPDHALTPVQKIEQLAHFCENEKRQALRFLRKQILSSSDTVIYEGALFTYADFFMDLINWVIKLTITPNGPIFLMIDDADNLTEKMQKIINSWVSYRTTDKICLKISTQQRYKTWRTTQGILIESPHDYSEIDINSIYTSNKNSNDKYYNRVLQVVSRRLEMYKFTNTNPYNFFPENQEQLNAINIIKQRIKDEWETKGISSRINDDILRYASSDYMKELAEKKKKNFYSYAGFKSMVNISSGMIRAFLEPAARMFSELQSQGGSTNITFIPTNIQDSIIKEWSEEFFLDIYTKMKEETPNPDNSALSQVDMLRNLITGIGELFQAKFLSDGSERRYISFMLTSYPSNKAQEILDLAIEWGYLHRSSIGKKEGVGRNILYILNRRLAPLFQLDPSGYAAHMSITSEDIELAMMSPRKFISKKIKPVSSSPQIQLDI